MKLQPYLAEWFQFCPHCQAKLEVKTPNYLNCPACEFEYYNDPATAVAVLIERDDKLLMAQRKREPKMGYWDTPGGFVDVGETAEETVIREVKEETTLDVKIVSYLGSKDDLYGLQPTINLIYLTKIIGHDQARAQDDVAQLAWLTPTAILDKPLAFTNTRRAVELYQQYRKETK